MESKHSLFRKTAKQTEATRLMTQFLYVLLYGGSRSGKTFLKIRNMIIRGMAVESNHVMLRKTFNSIKRSVWQKTIPDVIRLCFSDVPFEYNNTDFILKIPVTDQPGKFSSLWVGGLDSGERLEKLLGNEYSTIGLNECSQMNYGDVELVETRLAENVGLDLAMWFDCNPPSQSHWSYLRFFKGINPADRTPYSEEDANEHIALQMNPYDNEDNLDKQYFKILGRLGKRARKRFLSGEFSSDIKGALWDSAMIASCQLLQSEEWLNNELQTVVGLDPNVSQDVDDGTDFSGDEVGIVVCSKDTKDRSSRGRGLVKADYSGDFGVNEWVNKAIWAYHIHDADAIIAEVNQGGDLVRNSIHAVDPRIRVKTVRASKGKYARAEPVSVLYEQGKIKHSPGLHKLEEQMETYVPGKVKKSPGRLDAMVYANTDLFLTDQTPEEEVIFQARIL